MKNANRWAPGGVRPYLVALAAILIAFGVRIALQQVLGSHSAFLSFTIAAILVGAYGGIAPASVVVVSGLVLGAYFFLPPYGTFTAIEPLDLARVGGYLLVNVPIVVLIEWLQRSRYEARINLQIAQQHLDELLRRGAELREALQVAQQTQERLQALAAAAPAIWHVRRLNSRFEYVNDEFYKLTGLPPGSLEADGWTRAMHPDDVEVMNSVWQRVANTGNREMAALRLQMADGSFRQFRGWVQRADDKHGHVIKWTGV